LTSNTGVPSGLEEPLLDGVRLDPTQRFGDRVLRMRAPPHFLDDEKRRHAVKVGLSASRRAASTHGGIDVVPGAQDRRVSHPPRDLE
jgi:hypothetical protein